MIFNIKCPECGQACDPLDDSINKVNELVKCNCPKCKHKFQMRVFKGYIAEDVKAKYFELGKTIVGSLSENFKLNNVFLAFSVENPDKHVEGEEIVFCSVKKGQYNAKFMRSHLEAAIKVIGVADGQRKNP